jgi:hypothetical protein
MDLKGKQIQFQLTTEQIEGIVTQLNEMKTNHKKVLQLKATEDDPVIVITHADFKKV